MESFMLRLTKQAPIAIAATLGIALSAPWAVPARAGSTSSNTVAQSQAAPLLRTGDLVHLRSGSPLMIVTSVQGDQVTCSWSEWDGGLRSETFPIALFAAPVTLPSGVELGKYRATGS
jgi:uncharacterized protein YodC (DUF2158 family)